MICISYTLQLIADKLIYMIYIIIVIYLQLYLIFVNIIYFCSKIWLLYQLQDIFSPVTKST